MRGAGGVGGGSGGSEGAFIPVDGITHSVLVGDFGRDLVTHRSPFVDKGGEAGYSEHRESLEACHPACAEQIVPDFC